MLGQQREKDNTMYYNHNSNSALQSKVDCYKELGSSIYTTMERYPLYDTRTNKEQSNRHNIILFV